MLNKVIDISNTHSKYKQGNERDNPNRYSDSHIIRVLYKLDNYNDHMRNMDSYRCNIYIDHRFHNVKDIEDTCLPMDINELLNNSNIECNCMRCMVRHK